jgi:hypothetical protein
MRVSAGNGVSAGVIFDCVRGTGRGNPQPLGRRVKSAVQVALPIALIGVHTVGLSVVRAQGADSLTIDIGQCVVLESERERLECYERLANAAIEAEPGAEGRSAAPPVVDSAAEPAARPVPAQPAASAGSAAAASEAAEDEEIHSRVTAVEEYLPNRYRVTLENGQVWRQMQAKRYLLRPGHQVRIYPSRWGESYRLSAEELNGFIQVERAR